MRASSPSLFQDLCLWSHHNLLTAIPWKNTLCHWLLSLRSSLPECVAADSEVTAHSVAASVCMLPLPSSEGPERAGENIETGAAPRGCLWASGCIPRRDLMLCLTVSTPTVYYWGRLWLIFLKISLHRRISLIDEDRGQLKCRTARGYGELYQMHLVMGNGKRLVNEWTSKPDLHQKPNCINIFLSVYYRPDIILSDFHTLFNSYGG